MLPNETVSTEAGELHLSKRTRGRFVEFASEGVLAQIRRVYEAEDFEPVPAELVSESGERRTLAARYDAGAEDPSTHDRLARVYVDGVETWGRGGDGELTPSAKALVRSLQADGVPVSDDGRLEASPGQRTKRRSPVTVTGGKLFISHAVRDAELAEAIMEMLRLGTDIAGNQIFLSSLPEAGVPSGVDFVDYMRDELTGAELVLQLITPSFFESAFCLCELGAQWGMGLPCFPLVVPPVDYFDLTGVLGQIQAAKIDRSTALDELYDRVRSAFSLDPPTAQWMRQRDRFLERLPGLLERLAPAAKIDKAKHDRLVEELEESSQTLEVTRQELESARRQVAELAALKDPQEVAAVISDGELEGEFETALAVAQKAVEKLPPVIVEALFYDVAGLVFAPTREEWESVDREVANGRLRDVGGQEGSFEPDVSDPPVRRAADALRVLADFVPDKALRAKFEDEHDVAFDFTKRRVWVKTGLIRDAFLL